jgi:Domain of unknown function (DUF1918)
MEANTGDRIALETERVGQPPREGEVLEVVQGAVAISYRIRWDDGHESLFTPAAGSVRVTKQKRQRKTAKR